jgi:hypothetical protein
MSHGARTGRVPVGAQNSAEVSHRASPAPMWATGSPDQTVSRPLPTKSSAGAELVWVATASPGSGLSCRAGFTDSGRCRTARGVMGLCSALPEAPRNPLPTDDGGKSTPPGGHPTVLLTSARSPCGGAWCGPGSGSAPGGPDGAVEDVWPGAGPAGGEGGRRPGQSREDPGTLRLGRPKTRGPLAGTLLVRARSGCLAVPD